MPNSWREFLERASDDWIDELFIPIREIVWMYHEDLDNTSGTILMEETAESLEVIRERLEESPRATSDWYTLVKDDDGHEYVIPADKRDEYYDYMEAVYAYWAPFSDKDNLELPDEPGWLVEVNGRVRFREYEID